MALNIWTEPPGFSFGSFYEKIPIDIPLPVTVTIGIDFALVSGRLPPGLQIYNGRIDGTPTEVKEITIFNFTIRASANGESSDREFKMTIKNNVWTELSGFSFGTIYEKLKTRIPLPVISDSEVRYSIIPNSSYNIIELSREMSGVDVVVSISFRNNHSFLQNDIVFITGVEPTAYNGSYRISNISSSTTLEYIIPNTLDPGVCTKFGQASSGDTSGELPSGLYIEGTEIIGTPAQLVPLTPTDSTRDYTFRIRAYRRSETSDRVFSLTLHKDNIWTEKSGYNFGYELRPSAYVSSGQFISGREYVIASVGTTDFRKIGAPANSIGISFVATNTGSDAGPIINDGITPGDGIASSVPFLERSKFNIHLPVVSTPGFSYFVLSGQFPPGLRISGEYIVGTPFEVARLTTFSFCLRATNTYQICDRTFKITIDGADAPEFITAGGENGLLPVGTNQQYFVLGKSYVEFQIDAIDYDTATGQRLSFFIAEDEGQLPPGLVLTTDGRIVGYVQPVLSIRPEDGNGYYDIGYFDTVAYDWGYRPSNGYDSYLFDDLIFDYSVGQLNPKALNRNYEFIVSVTDGDSVAKRKYKIFVVADDYFRADNTYWLNGTGLFTADVTYLRSPLWITPRHLGTYRANNYVTLIIDTYDTDNIVYRFELVNSDITATTYQATMNDNVVGSMSVTIINPTAVPTKGQCFTFNRKFNGGTERLYYINNVEFLGNNKYRLNFASNDVPLDTEVPNGVKFFIGSPSVLPPGLTFDVLTAEVVGSVPYQPAITSSYKFTITATRLNDKPEIAESSRTFTIDIIGEIDSVIKWHTDPYLGTINANFVSVLSVIATSTVPNAVILYHIKSGQLPPGLQLSLDGEIIGKVNQYPVLELNQYGIITFDRFTQVLANSEDLFGSPYVNDTSSPRTQLVTTFDEGTTTFDYDYKFTVEAKDQFGLSATTREFTISIAILNQLVYSNLRAKPFLSFEQRSIWKEFINDAAIFTPSSIYRPNDPNFGIQRDLSMIVFAGIETKEAARYMSAIGLNHKKKRFHFGSIQKAVANVPGTYDAVYEVIYIEMIDPLEINGYHLPAMIKSSTASTKITVDKSNSIWAEGFLLSDPLTSEQQKNISDLAFPAPDATRPDPIMSVDSTGYITSDSNIKTYYPNSISNWRERIGEIGEKERNYLPLWMRSIQPGTKRELDFKLAVPLCYCKVGTADDIILNIKFSKFDFKLLDYTIDRYIIDSVEGSTADKYLVFKNDRISV